MPRAFNRWCLAACGLLVLSAACFLAAPAFAVESSSASSANDSPAKRGTLKSYGLPQVDYINEMIRKVWKDKELTPSGMASDNEWCRRVYLDILGRTPKIDELQYFLTVDKADKSKLVERLLNDEKGSDGKKQDYTSEYANNWATLWSNTLIGRPKTNREEMRSLVNREGMHKFLRDAFATNMPYDKFVYELIDAKGNTTPGAAPGDEHGHKLAFNGATNFLVGNLEDNGVQATAKTAQIFLGLQVQCTQCHNHPFNDWKQNQFWEFNAFFRQTHAKKYTLAKRNTESAKLQDSDFKGEGGKAEVYYELRNGKLGVAYPVFVDGRPLNEMLKKELTQTGSLSQVDRRTELAKLVTTSSYFSKAIVNRMWAHFMGYGFTKPIDDMGPHNLPTHPELLDRLAADFAGKEGDNYRYDLKRLTKWIVLSEPYALSSHFNPHNKTDDPTIGEKPSFSHFYLRQMRAEELYASLLSATEAEELKASADEQQKTKNNWLKQFTIAFGTDEGDDTTTFNGTIPQVLMMMNGDLVKKATSTDKGGFLEKVVENPKIVDKVTHLYLAGLSRKPSKDELMLAKELVVAKKGNWVAACQDIWWSILNSNEFIINH